MTVSPNQGGLKRLTINTTSLLLVRILGIVNIIMIMSHECYMVLIVLPTEAIAIMIVMTIVIYYYW